MTAEIIRYIHIGLHCVQENIADKPTMASIVLMLNSYSITLPTPSKPVFFMHSSIESNTFLQWQHDSRVTELTLSIQASINDVSIIELSPRKCFVNLKCNTIIFLIYLFNLRIKNM